ncbi:unnamed protein product [Paramecium sonneborni]|uniref:Uncharacterized protein n=1 Tax=Paramecium sonneborni TaxID=65129 RepID=A0A8S1R9N1_9CILI|nr:unnamed protein product [Paramecium sonneborni]
MIKPKMKEKEQDFISSCQHRQPICIVVFDPNLNNNQRLLCPLCLANFESNKKMIGIGKVIQMIEENHNDKIFRVQNNFELVKQLQESLRRLQTFTHEKLQMLIVSIENWLKQICERYQSYSFFVELENLIKNECSDPNIYSDMKVTYESHFCKIAQNLQQFGQQYSEILQTISDSFQQQGIKNAIQPLPKAKRVKINQIKEDHNNKEINESIEQLQEKYYYLQLSKIQQLYKTIINNYNMQCKNYNRI